MGIRTTGRTFRFWLERNKKKTAYIDTNKLVNGKRDFIRTNRLTDAEITKGNPANIC